MPWKIPKLWEGGEVWILGGGPSVTTEFGIPQKLVQSVVDGTSTPNAYSEYMQKIHDKHVIGINVAYLIGNWIDIVFFGDHGFFLGHQARLVEHPGLKVTCHPQITSCDWVKFVARDTSHPRGISTTDRTVSWNGNSGAAAISLAYHLGAKRIILVGFDMKLDANSNQHWHDLYQRKQHIINPKSKKRMQLPFDRHMMGFPEIAKDAKRLGVEIINASPDSAITDFPKCRVNDLL